MELTWPVVCVQLCTSLLGVCLQQLQSSVYGVQAPQGRLLRAKGSQLHLRYYNYFIARIFPNASEQNYLVSRVKLFQFLEEAPSAVAVVSAS